MTGPEGQTFSERVAGIRTRFVSELPARVRAVFDILEGPGGEDLNETRARRVHRILHDIAGSAAMLELYDIEAAARRGLEMAEVSDVCNTPLNIDSRSIVHKSLREMLAIAASHAADSSLQ